LFVLDRLDRFEYVRHFVLSGNLLNLDQNTILKVTKLTDPLSLSVDTMLVAQFTYARHSGIAVRAQVKIARVRIGLFDELIKFGRDHIRVQFGIVQFSPGTAAAAAAAAA
jgi:hypothetical protein